MVTPIVTGAYGTVPKCFENKLGEEEIKGKIETIQIKVLYIDLRPDQTCHSKVMHRKEVTHSDGSYEKKSRRRPWLKKWDKVKIPWYTQRVTSELYDSYFRLMMIKHATPKIEWAIELLYNSEEIGSEWVGDQVSWRQDVVGKATTQQKGPLGPPVSLEIRCWQDVVEKASTQQKAKPPVEQHWRTRHNADGHKSGGQYIAFLFGLQLPLTRKPNNKVRGIFLKKSSLVFYCFVGILHVYVDVYACEYTTKALLNHIGYRKESCRPEGTCYHLDFSEKPPVANGVKSLQGWQALAKVKIRSGYF